jgi:thioredoxin-like negative regulator of GroEL
VRGRTFPVLATYPFTSKAKSRGSPNIKANADEFVNAGFMALLREAQKEAEPLRIHVMDMSNFHKKMAAAKERGKRFFVLFNAGEWCPPCMQLKPMWPEMARMLQEDKEGKKIAVGTVDCDAHGNLCRSLGLDGFPSMHYYAPDRKEPTKYQGERDANALKEFAIEQLTSQIVSLDPRSVMQKVQSGQTLLVCFNAGQWCPPCMAIKPKFKRASNLIGNVPATFVDCDQEQEFCMMFQIEGYPTVMFFHKGRRHAWDGNPMAAQPEHIAQWVKSLNN